LSLLAGQRGTRTARWTLFVLPLAWLAGGLAGARMSGEITLPVLTTVSFAVLGLLVVLAARVPAAVVAGLALGCGLAHGVVNGATLSPTGASLLGLAGVVTGVFCLSAILSAQVTTLRSGWTRILVRVIGSWIAAAGLLMLGWLARPLTAT
jgi:hydrogenase/urease accessory protein HupE